MYKLTKNIVSIEYFYTSPNRVLYFSDGKLYLNEELFLLEEEILGGYLGKTGLLFITTQNKIYQYKDGGDTFLFISKPLCGLLEIEIKKNVYLTRLDNSTFAEYDIILNKTINIFQLQFLGLYPSFYKGGCIISHLFSENKIQSQILQTGKIHWQTDLSGRKYLDIWHEEKEVKIQRIIGLYENQLLVAFSNEELISIDTQTGKILWETNDFIKTNLPDSRNISQFRFVYWHIENGKMYQLDGNVYYSIDLNTQAVEILWIDNSNENYLTITHKTYTEDYIFFTGSYNQRLQPHLVGVFNRKTLSVDWIHDVDLTIDPKMGYPPSLNQAPQVDGNKLYVLDTGSTLHIFEKTEDN